MNVTNIKKITKLKEKYRRCDIEVENSNNFFANDILVHNSNFQLAVDKEGVQAGKRSAFLEDTGNFFNFQVILDKYTEAAKNIFGTLEETNVSQISIFGELYGGLYPHADVKVTPNASKVQKGICYCPHNDMIVFDIYCHTIDDVLCKGYWMPYYTVQNLCKTHGLMSLDVLFAGTMEDALNYSNSFETTIPSYHELPPIADNICEGIVIKSDIPKHFGNGERVIIKSKNDKWSEKAKGPKVPEILSDEVVQHIENIKLLVTENRLKNLLSKFGSVAQKEFGKLMSGMMSDVMNEYLKDVKDSYNLLGKADQKKISKKITSEIAMLIRPNFVNILDGTY